jgi:protein SCO1
MTTQRSVWLIVAMLAWFARVASGAAAVSPANADLLGVRYEQKIGVALPLDAIVHDETGALRPLRTFFAGRPVVVWFGYARCPQLCSVVADATVETLRRLVPSVGGNFDVLYISIDPTDTPRDLAGLKARDAGRYGRTETKSAWHYVGGSTAAVEQIASAAGFHFTFDPRSKLYAHPSGFVVVTPQGVVSRYFLGVDYAPKDVASALRRAADGKTGESVFDLLLVCARGVGVNGRYTRMVWIALDVGVVATVGLLGWGIARMLRDDRRRTIALGRVEVPR